jgi:hypothetical protein
MGLDVKSLWIDRAGYLIRSRILGLPEGMTGTTNRSEPRGLLTTPHEPTTRERV